MNIIHCRWCGRHENVWMSVRVEYGRENLRNTETVSGLCEECANFAVMGLHCSWQSIKAERRAIECKSRGENI